MSQVDIQQVLSQMRTVAAQAQGLETRPAGQNPGVEFADVLKQSVNKVNDAGMQAGRMTEAFEHGEANLGEVMVALQKANVSFQAMTQVRNKLVEAYKDVMNMPI